MAVRNWWIEADIDGRKTLLSGGPRNKDGGFRLTIRQRNKGAIDYVGEISGRVNNDGDLVLGGFINGTPVEKITER